MKRLLLILFVISFIWGQGTQTNHTGDPSKLPQPGGYLAGGFTNENIKIPELGWQNNTFKAYHWGLALPIIGYHFHP